MENTQPVVAKTTWTDADFDTMGWHDNAVHAVAWEPLPRDPGRLMLDIDYILQWVAPEPPVTTFSFWISPATLVFDRAWYLITNIDRTRASLELFLTEITRSAPDERGNYEWTLDGDGITISLGAPGFTQYLRRPPVHCPRYALSVEERGGFSFDRRGYRP